MSFQRHSVAIVACALLLVGACGDSQPTEDPASWGETGAWVQGKPSPMLGRVRAAVVERPSRDRAVIEARWEAHAGVETCELELVVPPAVSLFEGETAVPLPAGETSGAARWLVEFPVGRDLDAVVRFCGHTETGRRSADVAVRLVSAAEDEGE